MNGPEVSGCRTQRSGGHQREFSSDNFVLDAAASTSSGGAGGNKCLHSASLHQVEYSRMLRSAQRGMSWEFLAALESPATPSRSSSQRRNGDDEVTPSELSPGILDLHSFDTELLPEIPVPGLYDSAAHFGFARGRSFDDSEPSFHPTTPSNNNLLKGFSADKEKPGSVAKIKVVVRKRTLNKK